MGDGKISDALRPHCLAAQDAALSRLKHEFEPRWGHTLPAVLGGFPFRQPSHPRGGDSRLKHEFEPRWGHTLPAVLGGFPFTSPLIPVEGTQG
jgi:hypothetical protein